MQNSINKFDFKTSLRIKILIVFITMMLIVLMFPKGESIEFEVTVGNIWLQDDLIASMAFPLLKDKNLIEKEKEEVFNKLLPVYVQKNNYLVTISDSLNRFLFDIKNKFSKIENSEELKLNKYDLLSQQSITTLFNLYNIEAVVTLQYDRTFDELSSKLNELFKIIYEKGYISEGQKSRTDSISLRNGKYESTFGYKDFYNKKDIAQLIKTHSIKFSSLNDLQSLFKNIATTFITPNIYYDEHFTERVKLEAENKISKNVGIVKQDERIVAKHDRITREIKQKIESYRAAKSDEIGFWGKLLQNLGKFLHVSLIFLIFTIYIYLFRKKIFNDNLKILLICILILFVSSVTYLLQNINVKAPVEYLVILPVISMLLTIMFDSRMGFYGTVVTSLICGALSGNDYVFAVSNIIAGALAAYTVRDIKNRSQIFRSFIFILIGYFLSIVAFGLERFENTNNLMYYSIFAFANALVSPILTFGLIIFLEKIFGITTELTFLELTDFNHPLLRELARNAPGTFNHSMAIGALVENAAEKIKANPILARVGAYFHDIGKAVEPFVFVENQITNENLHENLHPERSAELILNHVTNGIELARKHKLPEEVINFIPMHHGTMVIAYFHEKAKQLYGEEKVNINEYSYKGPKPNTKETALLMLADGCESAVRSLEDPEPAKIERFINNLIQKRIDDGQLDESPLTFEDIRIIKTSFLNSLVSQHHKRIRYPKQEDLEKNNSELKDG